MGVGGIGYVLSLRKDFLDGNWSKRKQRQFNLLYGVPGIRQAINYELDTRRNDYYMRTRDLDYKDIYDPRNLSQAQSGSALMGSALNFVSSNVTRLYRDYNRDSIRDIKSDAYDRGFRNSNNYWRGYMRGRS